VSTGDTKWEQNIMETFHEVSPAFKAISSELAVKTFDIAKDVRHDDTALLRTLREIFVYLSLLGSRFRHPSDWGSVSFQTIDCSASSLVFAYALYLSCTSLRRNASRSPSDVFNSTHKVILSALAQSEALCDRVTPKEMTVILRESLCEEFELAKHGLSVVQACNELATHANSMVVLQPSEMKDGSGPVTAVRSLIHTSLLRLEGSHQAYSDILVKKRSLEPPIYQLPCVLQGIRKVAVLTFEVDEYDLRRRIRTIVDQWSEGCPFLNKKGS